MNIYYVYAYLRKKDNTPYYIGKGKGKRAYCRFHSVSVPKDKSKIVVYHINLTNEDACTLEKSYIKLFGRKDLGTGILLNQTSGGDGGDTSKSKAYLEAKAANKFSTKGMKNTPEHNQKIANALRGRKRPLEVGRKVSETRKGMIVWKARDLNIYTFRHPKYGEIRCTRHEFTEKYSDGKDITGQLLCKRPVTRQGWIVVEKWEEVGLLDENGNVRTLSRENYSKPNVLYTFTNPIHGTITCTVADLKSRFGLTRSMIRNMFMILPGTSKGWSVVRQ